MSRAVGTLSIFVLVCIFLTASALAQPAFDPDGGTWSANHPGIIDSDGTPGPSAGDAPFWPEWLTRGTTQELLVNTPCGDGVTLMYSVGGGGAGILDRWLYNGVMFTWNRYSSEGDPMGGDGDSGGSMGSADLLDSNGDGLIDAFNAVIGTGPSPAGLPMEINLDFDLIDSNGDNAPDYAGLTIPNGNRWIDPHVRGSKGCPAFQSLSFPLVDLGDGFRRVAFDPENDDQLSPFFLASPPFFGIRGVLEIPTVNQWGLALMILGLVLVSLRVLRQTA